MSAGTAPRRALFLQVTEAGAYPPTIHASQILCEAGWHVDVLSAPLAGHRMRVPASTSLRVHEIGLRPDFRIRPRDLWRYVGAAAALARQSALALVYASDPAAALPALIAARLSGARLVYHEHDSPNRPEHLNRVFRFFRSRILQRADHLVFPNAQRGQAVQAQYGFAMDKLLTIWNTPRQRECVANIAGDGGPLVLYYHGSINAARLPLHIADVIARFDGKIEVRIAGYESPSARGYANAFAERARFGQYLGEFQERAELFEMAKRAHVGLCFMPMQSADINMQAMTGASNKAFDYMAAGMNLLVSALPDWQSMFVEPGFARSCNPEREEELYQAFQWFLQNRSALAKLGARNTEQIAQHWHYERSFAPLMTWLS